MSDALNLWFFRDLNDDQRLKLFGLFGLPIDEIGAHHGRQSVALKQVMQSLIKMVAKEVSPSPQTLLRGKDEAEMMVDEFEKAFFSRCMAETDARRKAYEAARSGLIAALATEGKA